MLGKIIRDIFKPAERPVVLGGGPYAQALAEALTASGAVVTRIDGAASQVVAAHGHSWVKSVDVVDRGAKKSRRIKCDLLAVAALPAPASELPRQHGVAVELQPEGGGFVCRTDGSGRTEVAAVFTCGDVNGFAGPERTANDGAKVGELVGRSFS